MEDTSEVQNDSSNPRKRPPPSEDNVSKKVRLSFVPGEFRKQIHSEQKTQALQKFLQLVSEAPKNGVAQAYFEGGGSLLEIVQLIEGDSAVSPVLVFDIVNKLLLQISTKLLKYQNSASDACHYLLNNYVTLINKMLSLSSSTRERLATLKLLTTIVTCSIVLAKEILLHVNFNPTNLELLIKASEGKSEVRGAFIHFITAFLVDGHYPTLSVLLEKRGLMTSIVNGLQYDRADTVVLVLTVMRNHILENGSVTKTTKMKTFSTPVVKDIVNLYNWKGPAGLIDYKNKTKPVIDEVEKSKVSEAVHSFLLVLCTSHKLGVVFKDPLIGSGKRVNSLMYTVLESLERPWEHSYAGELVIKICRACPDLVKTMWVNLKPFLEPRWTVKWLKAVKFACRLLEELQPDCIEGNSLNTQQLSQVITVLVSPLPILKMVIPESRTFEQPAIKYNVVLLILKMTESIHTYLNHLNNDNLRTSLAHYIQKNFPDPDLVLCDWDKTDADSSIEDYLNAALDLLQKYKTLAPKILTESPLNLDIADFISKTDNVSESLRVKTVDTFLSLEPTRFRPKSDLFESVLTFCLKFYQDSKDVQVFDLVNRLLKNTSVFDGFHDEIGFWIDGMFNLKGYDDKVPAFLSRLVQNVDENAAKYHKELFELRGAKFSPLVLSLAESVESDKAIRNYLNFVLLNIFHLQGTESVSFVDVVSNCQVLPAALRNYFANWSQARAAPLEAPKGKLMEQLVKFSGDFLEGQLEIPNFELYPSFRLNLLQAAIFYVTNLIKAEALNDDHVRNCQTFIDYLVTDKAFDDDRYVRTVLGNSTLVQNVTLHTPKNFSTKIVVDVVKSAKAANVETYLVDLREKIVANILKMFRKPQKYQSFVISLEIIETVTLSYEQCTKLVTKFVNSYDNKGFYQVVCYSLDTMAELGQSYNVEPLSDDTVNALSKFLMLLLQDEVANSWRFSQSLHNYLNVFPHSLEAVDPELFTSLVTTKEFNKDNLALCEFILDRTDCSSVFAKNLDEICSKKSFLLALLDTIVRKNQANNEILGTVFAKFESHVVKVLQKPHKAGQHFQNRYKSVGILLERFMKPDGFSPQVQKFEVTELFHVYLLKKVYEKIDKTDKVVINMITTFIHLLVNLLKQNKENLPEIGEIFIEFLREIENSEIVLKNETVKMFYKLCLKHGVSGDFILLKILTEIIKFCPEEDSKLILEMLMSHSQFLDVILSDSQKGDLLSLWLAICAKWPHFMERNHVPVLLSAYRGTRADAVALKLLKMYESKSAQTKFFDFKPFLWSRGAASHYSVRSDLQKTLWRQPKMADVLNNLSSGTINLTINDPTNENSYDLDYFLPVFSNLLAPENPVATYHFTKSGALALALVGLRGDKSQRLATCYVLQRFYFHLEAKQNSKDNILWLRFIEAICKGIGVFDDFKINNFVGVFLARTALILTQPNHVMYVPLSQYLAAKDALDFSTIPELYTLLHSPHVDSKEHKLFILEVIKDGLRNEKDFTTLLRSMGFKLVSELCSSTVCDSQTKISILQVFEECCKTELGIQVLCGNLSFLTQVICLILWNIHEGPVLVQLLNVLLRIVEVDRDRHRNFLVYINMISLVEEEQYFRFLKQSTNINVYFKILMTVVQRFPDLLCKEHLSTILEKTKDKFCNYLAQYGCRFLKEEDLLKGSSNLYYLRMLFYNKLK